VPERELGARVQGSRLGPALPRARHEDHAGAGPSTDEAVFDGALKDVLEIQLQQSPYLNVMPSSEVQAALRTMG